MIDEIEKSQNGPPPKSGCIVSWKYIQTRSLLKIISSFRGVKYADDIVYQKKNNTNTSAVGKSRFITGQLQSKDEVPIKRQNAR